MLKRVLLTLGVIMLVVPAVMAQELPPPPPMPGLMIPLPEGMMPPPPEDGPEAFDAFMEEVFAQIAGDDGVMTLDELKDWMKEFEPPMDGPGGDPGDDPMGDLGDDPMGDPPEGDMGMIPEPPECTEELVSSEMLPQNTNMPCGDTQGNEIFRTVCNSTGYNSRAISLPAGRMAGCFGIEAITPNVVIFTIYPEDDPAAVVFDSDVDGLESIHMVKIEGEGVYRIDLDMDRSDPDARVTVRFVDHPGSM